MKHSTSKSRSLKKSLPLAVAAYCAIVCVGRGLLVGRSPSLDEYGGGVPQPGPKQGTKNSPQQKRIEKGAWGEAEIVSYMKEHPNRNYFAHLFAYGGFRRGIEVGVQDGRFSEIFVEQNSKLMKDHWQLVLVEPYPTEYLYERLGLVGNYSQWDAKGYLLNCEIKLEKTLSTDPELLAKYPDGYFDFIYLDAFHAYEAVKLELPVWWKKLRPGGVMAGHDYCNYGEPGLSCSGCQVVPECRPYTEWGWESAGQKHGRSANQNGVVMAVQEWMVKESRDSSLVLRYTVEDFTKESLAKDGFDFDIVVRRDRNPSWYIYKP